MNGDFDKWSKDVLSLIEESNKSNKEEHTQIIDKVNEIGVGIVGRFQRIHCILFVLLIVVLTWEVYFHILVK